METGGPAASQTGWRLPRFSPNSFLSLLLHGFGASAFARNAYSLARLMGEFSDGFLTVVAATAMLYLILIPCHPAIYDIEIYDLRSTYATRLSAGGVRDE